MTRRGPKRNKQQKASQKKKAAQLREQGKTLREIGSEVGLHHTQVWHDLNEVEAEILEEAKDSLEAHRARVLAKLRKVQIESRIAWERSLQDKERYTEKESAKTGLETSSMREGQSGNPTHMTNMIKAIEKEAQLLGLLKPDAGGGEDNQDLIAGLSRIVEDARARYDSES